jgi:AraC family transcriptional regulator
MDPDRSLTSPMAASDGYVATNNSPPGRAHLGIAKNRCWDRISVGIIDRAEDESKCANSYHRLTYFLTDFEGTIQADGAPEQTCRLRRGTFAFRPRGETVHLKLTAGRYIRILQCHDTYASLGSGVIRLAPRCGLSDPLVSQIVLSIAKEIAGGFLDHILVESLNTALAVQLTRLCGDPTHALLALSNGLSRERLYRVYEYVEGHLGSRLTLTDLASATGLSPYHFSRSFKQAAGIGPWRYVMQRRLERAKILMRQSDRSLALIAQEVGFADQSHLTAVFRREMGLTPGQFRGST